jgi:hypothetical protein
MWLYMFNTPYDRYLYHCIVLVFMKLLTLCYAVYAQTLCYAMYALTLCLLCCAVVLL